MKQNADKLQQDAVKVASLLKLLANPLRLLIVCHLAEDELFARQLNDLIGTTKGNVSQHLTVLLDAKIILRERRGSRIFYRIADPRVEALMQFLRATYCGAASGVRVKSSIERTSNNGKSRRTQTSKSR